MVTHFSVATGEVACGRNNHYVSGTRDKLRVSCRNCRSTEVFKTHSDAQADSGGARRGLHTSGVMRGQWPSRPAGLMIACLVVSSRWFSRFFSKAFIAGRLLANRPTRDGYGPVAGEG